MRKVSVIAITVTYLDMTFATTANITSVVETGDYFVRTVICTIIWASFPMIHVDDMRGDRMGDMISRQAAIDALADMHCKSDEDGYVWIIRSDAWARIDALPSVTPKQKRGKWEEKAVSDEKVIGEWQSARCSACGKYHTAPYMYYFNNYNFCPNCGARMTEEDV